MRRFFLLLLIMFVFSPVFSTAIPDVCDMKDDKNCLGDKLFKGIENQLVGEKDNAKTLTKYKIVKNFCDSIYSVKSSEKFDAKKSVFLQVLCTSIGEDAKDTGLKLKESKLRYYSKLKDESKSKKLPSGGNSLFGKCAKTDGILTDPDSMNNVDFTCVAKDIFDTSANDFADMATFTAYGGYGTENKRKKWEQDFFAGKDTPCEGSFVSSEDEDKKWCQHPQTKKYLDENAKQLKTMVKNLSLIEIEPDEIYDQFSVTKGDDKPGAVMFNIKDRTYNEMYYYKQFLAYYSSTIKIYNISFSLKKMTSDVNDIIKLNGEGEVIKSRQYSSSVDNYVNKTFDGIKNIYRTFPLHVGFLAMLEDYDKLRHSFSYIYTPIDQLRFKMEQAQDEDKK